MHDAVADAETFGDDGGEVGEFFELLQRGRLSEARDGVVEFSEERLQDWWVGEEMVGCCSERVGGRQGAGGYEAKCFLAEAVETSLRRGTFGVEDEVEDCCVSTL